MTPASTVMGSTRLAGVIGLVELLREHGVALALIDQGWMPRPWGMKTKLDLITADFNYVRWLGDGKAIEETTKIWDKVIVDRQEDFFEWVDLLKKVHERRIMILAFANNHYAGHGPATVSAETMRRAWRSVAPTVAAASPRGSSPLNFSSTTSSLLGFLASLSKSKMEPDATSSASAVRIVGLLKTSRKLLSPRGLREKRLKIALCLPSGGLLFR